MPRNRALLAILLAVAWCSAALHVELEAAGLMLDHEHGAHDTHNDHHESGAAEADHEPLFARDAFKAGEIRMGATGVLWFALLSLFAFRGFGFQPRWRESEADPCWREREPPLARVWQFVWRCAPVSTAPPALG